MRFFMNNLSTQDTATVATHKRFLKNISTIEISLPLRSTFRKK